ncbi:hypothetical protein LCGC14_0847110 [marine sediment metagenome]|uniref:Uncharacterized protein n=1 Tax=marine sediment metagenome TaxID=412755 RepID=A0A0F9RW93_9ZZZZ
MKWITFHRCDCGALEYLHFSVGKTWFDLDLELLGYAVTIYLYWGKKE